MKADKAGKREEARPENKTREETAQLKI